MSDERDAATRERPRDHDGSYKRVFQHPQLMQDLVDHFVDPALVQGLDWSKSVLVSGEFVGEALERREADKIWRIPYEDGSEIYLYLMLEFQSQVDRKMTLRVSNYVNQLQDRLSDQDSDLLDALPPVLPIVLYNGKPRWSAPTHMRQQHRISPDSPLYDYQPQIGYYPIDIGRMSVEELDVVESVLALMFQVEHGSMELLQRAVSRLAQLAQASPLTGLWGDLLTRLKEALRSRKVVIPPQEIHNFTEAETMAGETFTEWAARQEQQIRHDALQEGRQEGQQEGLQRLREALGRQLRLKFGQDEARAERLDALDADALMVALERVLSAQEEDAVFEAL